MLGIVASLITIYVFPTGRRLFAFERVREVARALAFARIVKHVDRAIEHDRQTQELELRSRAARTAHFGPEAQALDLELDQSVMGLHTFLDSQVRLYGADSERGIAALTIQQAIMPDGPQAIITQPYVQEHQTVRAMLTRLSRPDLAGAVAALPELDVAVAHIRTLNERYGEALKRARSVNAPTFDEVREARDRGQTLLCETVVLILGEFVGVEDDPRRDALLKPILEQNQAIRQARRRRRGPSDVDPDTGDEIMDDSADVAADSAPDSDSDMASPVA